MRKRYALAIILAAAAPCEAGDGAKKPAFRDAATHEELSLQLRKADQEDPMKALLPSEGADPSVSNQPQNLLESSDLISFQGLTTLVPKRAIIKLPEAFKDRVNNPPPGNRVVGWLDFYALNRGWITVVEITRSQAGGNEALAEGLSDQLDKSKNMIVTVLDSGPISYMPYRGDAETKKEELK
ncbi:hypothetical protein HZ994_11700 [Akkermansiaceae bacterium]|nr:hypothetical protein HZ994_11700 [Akkermansiaceae bacterium]